MNSSAIDDRPLDMRNDARRIVNNRATCRNRSAVGERSCRFDQAFATTHNVRDSALVFLCLRVREGAFVPLEAPFILWHEAPSWR